MLTMTTVLFLLSAGAAPAGGAGPSPTGDEGVRRCAAERAQSLVGRKGNRRTAERARQASGAREVRVIGWRNAYTQDLRSDRINLELDRQGRVRRIACF
jgi:hypothetical protein